MKWPPVVITAYLLGLTALACGGGGGGGNAPSADADPGTPPGESTTIKQYGVTWVLDGEYDHGTFANGDHWVKTNPGTGSVKVWAIYPLATRKAIVADGAICTGGSAGVNACSEWCTKSVPGYSSLCDGADRGMGSCVCSYIRNGVEVNSRVSGFQAFDSRTTLADARMVPQFSYSASAGETVFKIISDPSKGMNDYDLVTTASVLTIVADVPPERGQSVFRPPFVGTEKPQSPVAIQWSRLPSIAPPTSGDGSTVPTLDGAETFHRRCPGASRRVSTWNSSTAASISALRTDTLSTLTPSGTPFSRA